MTRLINILFFTLLFSFSSFAQKSATITRIAESSINIDGVMNESEWENAAILEGFADAWNPSAVDYTIDCRVLWDSLNLYIGIFTSDKHIVAPNETVKWNDDMFEIHLAPDYNLPHIYFLVEFNLQKAFAQNMRRNHIEGETIYNAKYLPGTNDCLGFTNISPEVEVVMYGTADIHTDVDSGWSMEVRIPFDSIKNTFPSVLQNPKIGGILNTEIAAWNPAIPPKSGSKWMANITRIDQTNAGEGFSASQWSYNGNDPYNNYHFHNSPNFGTFIFENPTSIEINSDIQDLGLISISPNPANPIVNINVTNAQNITSLSIYDINGKMIKNITSSLLNKHTIWNAKGRNSGVYFVVLNCSIGTITKRFSILK